MNSFNELKDIDAQFEDVAIHIHKLFISLVTDEDKVYSGFTNVWQGMKPNYSHSGCGLIGNFHILFRNQGADFDSCLFLLGIGMATSELDKSPRSVFCKFVQYLFDFMKGYCKDNNVMDRKGELFVLPHFGYDKDAFANLPDQ
jgi:hypothetical protein